MPVNGARITVPGNVLLLGEYAVLEEGGLGLAMAVAERVHLETFPADTLRIDTVWPGAAGPWTPETREASPLVSSVVDTVSEHLGRSPRARVKIDSSAFFSPDGRKTGLGSSAAVTVALACGLLRAAGGDPADAPRLALRAHRRAQGGRGSGYDVMTSFNGGAGLFTGGADQQWRPRVLPGGMRVVLFSGPAPVSTADAVARYNAWKESDAAAARDFLRESNNAIVCYLSAASDAQLLLWFSACRELGIELGRAIGIPAELPIPPGLDPRWCKALGAGNELGLCLLPPGAELPADDARFRFVAQSGTGAQWED